MPRTSRAIGAAALLASGLLALPAGAVGQDESSGTAKGTIGGVLLGAEIVLVTEAAFDLEPTWVYLAGGGAGAVGGGIAGYYIEQSASPRVSMLMLASGLTLAIPTIVAVLSATAYEPPSDFVQDTVPPDEPVADPPTPTSRRQRLPPGLIDIDSERVALSIPAVEVRDVYTRAELFVLGTKQATEMRVPLLSLTF